MLGRAETATMTLRMPCMQHADLVACHPVHRGSKCRAEQVYCGSVPHAQCQRSLQQHRAFVPVSTDAFSQMQIAVKKIAAQDHPPHPSLKKFVDPACLDTLPMKLLLEGCHTW